MTNNSELKKLLRMKQERERLKRTNMQGSYGAKKFIKPWRTGTKSQQLPARGGTGMRGGNGKLGRNP